MEARRWDRLHPHACHCVYFAAPRGGRSLLGTARRCAHWTTLLTVEVVGTPKSRVVHRAWLWTTRRAPLRRWGVLSTTAKHTVGNPCSARRWSFVLTSHLAWIDAFFRLPCPRGDCPLRWPLDGSHETRSPRGAGRPKRATGCSATVRSQERRSVSDPRGLPTR